MGGRKKRSAISIFYEACTRPVVGREKENSSLASSQWLQRITGLGPLRLGPQTLGEACQVSHLAKGLLKDLTILYFPGVCFEV